MDNPETHAILGTRHRTKTGMKLSAREE